MDVVWMLYVYFARSCLDRMVADEARVKLTSTKDEESLGFVAAVGWLLYISNDVFVYRQGMAGLFLVQVLLGDAKLI